MHTLFTRLYMTMTWSLATTNTYYYYVWNFDTFLGLKFWKKKKQQKLHQIDQLDRDRCAMSFGLFDAMLGHY